MVKKAIFLKLRKKLDSFCKINIVFYTFFSSPLIWAVSMFSLSSPIIAANSVNNNIRNEENTL